jgi:APA family basic amino acid/polyamine antiporter
VILLATTGSLFAYLFTALAALKLQWRQTLERSALLTGLAVIGAVYSVWAIWGAGREAAFWGLTAFLVAFPIYGAMRRSGQRVPETSSSAH